VIPFHQPIKAIIERDVQYFVARNDS